MVLCGEIACTKMKSLITAGILFLALCTVTHSSGDVTPSPDGDDSPPSNIHVGRPRSDRKFGAYAVVMDNRNRKRLTCTAEGTPEPTFRWEFNGSPVVSDDRRTVEDGVLTILKPGKPDEGNYQCFATNKYGTALSPIYNARLAFQSPFEDTTPFSYTYDEGDDAILECGAPDGAPKPRIYWTDDMDYKTLEVNERISYSAEGNLHFANLNESDAGGYHCFAANDFLGSFMRSGVHELTVNSVDVRTRPARISSLATSVSGLRTEKFKIKCLASGFPTPTISWFRNGQELPGSESGVSLDSFNQELVFASLGFDHAGRYECRASNSENEPAKQTVHLTVNSAPYFVNEPKNLVIAPGDDGVINCDEGGVPEPQRTWLQNGAEIRDSESSVYQVNDNEIIITNVREGDSTVFQCVLENEHGTEVGSYTVTVLAIPATISVAPVPRATASEGTSFQLDCLTFGSPTPTVEWHKDGVKLVSGGRITITEENDGATSHLNVSDLVLEDAGTYECRALNNVGNDTESSEISVRYKVPTTVTLTPETQNVIKGSRADFTCDVVADERVTPIIKWFFEETELNPNQRGSEYALIGNNVLRVLAAKTSHTGTFKCLAETEHDQDSATAELVVQAEPNAPYGLQLDINGLEATLSWTEPANNNAEIESYSIEYRTQHDTFPFPSDMAPWADLRTVSASISEDTIQLENYLEYSFRVTATNAVGTSEKSDVITGDMTPAAPPDEDSMPTGVTSEATKPGTLSVSWDEVHPFHRNGPDFEYVVRWRKEGETEWQEEVIDPPQTSFDITAEEYENIEFSVGVRNAEDDGPEPEEDSGTTGQGVPGAAPSNVKLVAISSNAINVSWDAVPEEEVNGELLHYKVYYTRQSQQGGTETVDCPADQTSCVVGGLEAYSNYEVQVAVVNGHSEGPRSEAQTIRTEEGVPSPSKIKSVQATSYRIAVKWDPPVQENGVHLGYHLQLLELEEGSDNIKNAHNETIDDAEQLVFILEDAMPETDYEVVLSAYTRVGDSTTEKAETRTAQAGAPVKPGKPVVKSDPKSLNVTWPPPPEKGPLPDKVRACYKVKGSDGECVYTDYVDVLKTDHLMIHDLEEGTEYEVLLEFENKDGSKRGEAGVYPTSGAGEKKSGGAGFPSWFIALICIIIFLLLILLIICILKTQKGGKYNVSDKEKQLKDENAPLKNNDGFAEFNQDSEFPDDMDGSQDSLASNPEGSEGDSLKEYADDEDPSKFNEEGSFIEEYHDPKTRSTDVREGGTSTFV